MKIKGMLLQLKNGQVIKATIDFYIETFNENEGVGHVEEIEGLNLETENYQSVEMSELTSEDQEAVQKAVDEVAYENAYEYWYEGKMDDAYDDYKDSKYED
jgi:hypothetical protein